MTGARAYKLFRQRRDGTLGPLFINRSQIIPLGVWLEAQLHVTKGFAPRKGWHCGPLPVAPHLSAKGRIWCEVRIEGFYDFQRPAHQGGLWHIAERICVVRIIEDVALELERIGASALSLAVAGPKA